LDYFVALAGREGFFEVRDRFPDLDDGQLVFGEVDRAAESPNLCADLVERFYEEQVFDGPRSVLVIGQVRQ
jgi:hypothetical protein